MVTAEQLAEIIEEIDPSAREWVYNRYCRHCGRYLYSDSECNKCGSPAVDPVTRPLPFQTSATAIEKLVVWAKKMAKNDVDAEIIHNIKSIVYKWYDVDDGSFSKDPKKHHQDIIESVYDHLNQHDRTS